MTRHSMTLLLVAALAAGLYAQTTATKKKSSSALSQFEQEILDRHNEYRAKHNVPPLKYSKKIAAYAAQWARTNARKNRMFHRRPSRYGENIYYISSGWVTGKMPVDTWYSEEKYYKYNKPGFTYKAGHFTQVIWKSTIELGCGKARSSRGAVYVVCNYYYPGNDPDSFKSNVLPPAE